MAQWRPAVGSGWGNHGAVATADLQVSTLGVLVRHPGSRPRGGECTAGGDRAVVVGQWIGGCAREAGGTGTARARRHRAARRCGLRAPVPDVGRPSALGSSSCTCTRSNGERLHGCRRAAPCAHVAGAAHCVRREGWWRRRSGPPLAARGSRRTAEERNLMSVDGPGCAAWRWRSTNTTAAASRSVALSTRSPSASHSSLSPPSLPRPSATLALEHAVPSARILCAPHAMANPAPPISSSHPSRDHSQGGPASRQATSPASAQY